MQSQEVLESKELSPSINPLSIKNEIKKFPYLESQAKNQEG